MITEKQIEIFIPHERQGEYFTIPFEMPENTASMELSYSYTGTTIKPTKLNTLKFTPKTHENIIDLGLTSPDGHQVGASGSDKQSIFISETWATPGYTPTVLAPGEWHILVGAYQVEKQGINVNYQLKFTQKKRTLLIGDIHTHTTASDGVLSLEQLADHAKSHGLDFLAVTDHNQMSRTDTFLHIEGLTLIPGVEWTHYKGHAGFLGVDQPYDTPFYTNTEKDALAKFSTARGRGALIVIDHPCDENCSFQFDLHNFPFDCLEIWNGPMRENNLRAVTLWQNLLASGRKIPCVGGSDYHRDRLFQILGGPCMGVYALSNSPADILIALRRGNSFIRFAPEGPSLQLSSGEKIMGDTQMWKENVEVQITASGLKTNDVLRVITASETTNLFQAPSDGDLDLSYPVKSPGFVRVEIYRTFIPGLPPLPALISNPIYFDA